MTRTSFSAAASLVALFALATAPTAGKSFRITVTGTVEFNQIAAGTLGAVGMGESATLTFVVDEDDFVDSPNFPTRGYVIDAGSGWTLDFDSGSIGLEDPYGGFGPFFVLRNDDPAVDGFLISDNVEFPVGVPLDQVGVFGPFENSFRVTYGQTLLPSLDIADAVGSYDFTGLTVFNWTIDDGPFNALGILFEELVIEPEGPPLAGDVAAISLSAGGSQDLALVAGSARAGWTYWIFGSATGTAPGLPFPGGVVLPLNFDPYFALTLNKPFLGLFGSFLATLDGIGCASASLTIPSGSDPALAGIVLHHAYLATPTFPGSDFASNAVAVTLGP